MIINTAGYTKLLPVYYSPINYYSVITVLLRWSGNWSGEVEIDMNYFSISARFSLGVIFHKIGYLNFLNFKL